MIEKVKKILIYGLNKEISKFFKIAQKEGIIEFVEEKKVKGIPHFLKKYLQAIKILKKETFFKSKKKLKYDETICDQILEIEQDINFLEEKKKNLKEELKKASPFGKFLISDIEYVKEEGQRFFQFFCKSATKKRTIPLDLIYIDTEYDLDYFVAINKEKKEYKGFIELTFENSIDVLEKKILNIDKQIKQYQTEIKKFTPYLELLKKDFIDKLNVYNLEKAKNFSKQELENSIFSIEGWIADSKIKKLNYLLLNMDIHYEFIKVDKEEIPPTLMKNNKFVKIGEDLVNIYDTPSQKDKDPSFWVLIAFTLFFAMIISDAGYGIIYLFLGFFLKYKIKKQSLLFKRFTNLVFLLSTSCIIWGVLTASFFGIDFKPESSVEKFSLLNSLSLKKADYHLSQKDDVYDKWLKKYPDIKKAKNGKEFLLFAKKIKNSKEVFEAKKEFNNNILLEFSILIGIIHIIISFLNNLKNQISGIGWIFFMIGGYLFFPSILNATSLIHFLHIIPKKIAFLYGKPICIFGIFLAALLALIQNKKRGLKEITKVVGVFGDVLSYLRLYALGLAGMILSQTFNEISSAVGVLGFLVLIIGHSINMILGIIGGIIHGLRLNFLEWYNHCFYGGGKLFNPLKLLKRR